MGTYAVDMEDETGVIEEEHKNANRTTRKGKTDGDLQFVEFLLGNEYFAIDLFLTREVITPTDITPLPNAPPYIKGVMDLRGSITTIIDLKTLINLPPCGDTKKRTRIIILDQEITNKPVGVLVDDVYSVSTHKSTEIDRDTDTRSETQRNITGVIRKTIKTGTKEEHKLILWLDIQSMITSIEKEI